MRQKLPDVSTNPEKSRNNKTRKTNKNALVHSLRIQNTLFKLSQFISPINKDIFDIMQVISST